MISSELVRLEAARYRLMAEELRAQYQCIDDDTLKDTLEGVSDLPQIIEALVRSSLDDGALLIGLKARIDEMQERQSRIKTRYDKKRELSAWAMAQSGVTKLEVPDFGVSLSSGIVRVEIDDTSKLPACYLVPQPPKPDRTAIGHALKGGQTVEGARLETGNPFITVRTR